MLGRLLALAAITSGCYSIPEPDCGFSCGPARECPANYTCAADRVCHRNGAPASLVCQGQDAGPDAPGAGPQIVMHDPSDSATGVPVDQVVTVTVDQDLVGIDSSDLYLMDVAGPVLGTTDYVPASKTAEIHPSQQLAPNMAYTVVVAAGITNATGAPLHPTQWMFTTGADTVAPRLATSAPFNGQTNVAVTTDIMLAFDEPVTGVDITSVTVSDGTTPVLGSVTMIDSRTYDFTPTAPLTSATTYTVALGNTIQDAYGNAFVPTTFSFTTQ